MAFEQPSGHHLAQFNIARALDALDSALLADFFAAVDGVNAIAERSPGFVWRPVGDDPENLDTPQGLDPRIVLNLSVWETPEHLEHFVWNTVHKRIYRRKNKWFEKPKRAAFVMWWSPIGARPTLREGAERLEHLQSHGPSADAFEWESLAQTMQWKTERIE